MVSLSLDLTEFTKYTHNKSNPITKNTIPFPSIVSVAILSQNIPNFSFLSLLILFHFIHPYAINTQYTVYYHY